MVQRLGPTTRIIPALGVHYLGHFRATVIGPKYQPITILSYKQFKNKIITE